MGITNRCRTKHGRLKNVNRFAERQLSLSRGPGLIACMQNALALGMPLIVDAQLPDTLFDSIQILYGCSSIRTCMLSIFNRYICTFVLCIVSTTMSKCDS